MVPINKKIRFAYQLPIIRTLYSYVTNKVRIRGYFSKLKGVRAASNRNECREYFLGV
jgi:hypothetical protein